MTKLNNNYSDLLACCVRQDKQAFQQLYHACSPKLYAVALHLLKQQNLAEEILEESFKEIWNTASEYNPEKEAAIMWMVKITYHNAVDKLRCLKIYPQKIEIKPDDPELSGHVSLII